MQIGDLVERMQTNWPTLACPSGDGSRFWSHEWRKHGTCSESLLDQRSYFQAALDLKKQVDLLKVLQDAGIRPDGGFYSLRGIAGAIREAIGYTPGIQCNVDESGNRQLYQVYLCVDTSGKELIECPVFPRSKCSSTASATLPTIDCALGRSRVSGSRIKQWPHTGLPRMADRSRIKWLPRVYPLSIL
ncbi:hypothetical protein B296_00009188 [Ensete ventricosum]|uniref:Uncharacterized protein n=1 Tax=Ensete ventricosum TaxID=4639 RepID=A0A426YRI6_ENSVE|nr:hypothetical protein B296_00009188 [Ensete ventricosum]